MGQRMSAVLVEQPPEFEFRDGFFFVYCPQSCVCRAYPPHQFFKTFAAMAEVAREYRFASAEVIPFPAQVDAMA
jgi:hypothetical protein